MDRAELDRRAEVLERLSAEGGPLSNTAPTATINNRNFYGRSGQPTPKRRRMQSEILRKYQKQYPEVEAGGQAIVMAGPPGAGKSTAKADAITATVISREKWINLDADEVKKLLLEQARIDGTLQAMVPPELSAEGIDPYPAEMASLVHEESSQLVKRLQNLAIRRKWNVIIDGTLANEVKSDALLTIMRDNGYTVHMVVVDISLADSKERIRDRWEKGVIQAEEGHDFNEGRWVPRIFAESMFFPDDLQHSRCHANAISLAKKHSHVLRLICRDGMTDKIVSDHRRDKSGGRLF